MWCRRVGKSEHKLYVELEEAIYNPFNNQDNHLCFFEAIEFLNKVFKKLFSGKRTAFSVFSFSISVL